MIDFERERSRLAAEVHNAGYVVHRALALARVLDARTPEGRSLGELDDLASALQDWSVAMSRDLVDQRLADDLEERTRRQREWRQVRWER